MADTEEKKNNLPLIILGVGVGLVVLYMLFKPKRRQPTPEELAMMQGKLPPVDPCLKPDGTRLPDWACGTVALLDPLAKAGTAMYQTKVSTDIQKAQMRQQAYGQ